MLTLLKWQCLLFGRAKVNRLVKRGYITRFSSEEFWHQDLWVFFPGEELPDGDAIPYYIDNGSYLVEYYGLKAPKDRFVYKTIINWEAFQRFVEECTAPLSQKSNRCAQ